ncbi:MAG: DUF4276 family protein [Candidatus Latescibacterota bacterium]
MRPLRLAAIVEGHGETEAVPILVRRIAAQIDPGLPVLVRPVLRIPSASLLRSGELERAVELAGRAVAPLGALLVLVDCDADEACPAREGPQLLARARTARSDLRTAVVLARREFEAWFIAAAASLRGRRGLDGNLNPPPRPEEIRGAKGWLSRHMPRSQPYAEVTDQPALTQAFDMGQARSADSFDKCYREIAALVEGHRAMR